MYSYANTVLDRSNTVQLEINKWDEGPLKGHELLSHLMATVVRPVRVLAGFAQVGPSKYHLTFVDDSTARCYLEKMKDESSMQLRAEYRVKQLGKEMSMFLYNCPVQMPDAALEEALRDSLEIPIGGITRQKWRDYPDVENGIRVVKFSHQFKPPPEEIFPCPGSRVSVRRPGEPVRKPRPSQQPPNPASDMRSTVGNEYGYRPKMYEFPPLERAENSKRSETGASNGALNSKQISPIKNGTNIDKQKEGFQQVRRYTSTIMKEQLKSLRPPYSQDIRSHNIFEHLQDDNSRDEEDKDESAAIKDYDEVARDLDMSTDSEAVVETADEDGDDENEDEEIEEKTLTEDNMDGNIEELLLKVNTNVKDRETTTEADNNQKAEEKKKNKNERRARTKNQREKVIEIEKQPSSIDQSQEPLAPKTQLAKKNSPPLINPKKKNKLDKDLIDISGESNVHKTRH